MKKCLSELRTSTQVYFFRFLSNQLFYVGITHKYIKCRIYIFHTIVSWSHHMFLKTDCFYDTFVYINLYGKIRGIRVNEFIHEFIHNYIVW